ncbi:hypothetical protein QAD02_024236 [Eretmocerus hayati]|uniref:Uncharacterized protein n=1 Tax=Eretmocerus hayati TaxID=131215 RepID=A0ACC2PZV5_9HYME|nr:hypothetical protein QAD02_024236 [Eretmocerus hayati]
MIFDKSYEGRRRHGTINPRADESCIVLLRLRSIVDSACTSRRGVRCCCCCRAVGNTVLDKQQRPDNGDNWNTSFAGYSREKADDDKRPRKCTQQWRLNWPPLPHYHTLGGVGSFRPQQVQPPALIRSTRLPTLNCLTPDSTSSFFPSSLSNTDTVYGNISDSYNFEYEDGRHCFLRSQFTAGIWSCPRASAASEQI